MATIKVVYELSDGTTETVMFGDSYKTWQDQKREYERYYPDEKVIEIWKSNSKWIGWGGLKWCLERNFQHELNREGVQDHEPDNPSPRQYSSFVFKRIQ